MKPVQRNASDVAELIGEIVFNISQKYSTNYCFRYCRKAIQCALGLKDQAICGLHCAWQCRPWLKYMGFSQIDSHGPFQNGDVLVFPQSKKMIYGHIQIYYNGRWYSDFKQPALQPQPGYIEKYEAFRLKTVKENLINEEKLTQEKLEQWEYKSML